jgi:hypothetical protein
MEGALAPSAESGASPDWIVRYADSRLPLAAKLNNPFLSVDSGMISTARDPFVEALSSGTSRGVLVLRGTIDDVPVYGLPSTAARSQSVSDRAILREIRSSLGIASANQGKKGAGVSSPRQDSLSSKFGSDENPFAKSDETGSKETKPAAETKPATETLNAKSQSDEPASAVASAQPDSADANLESAAAAPQDAEASESVQTPMGSQAGNVGIIVRPYAMIEIKDGSFKHMKATRLKDPTIFDTEELGVMPMNVLYFPKPADAATSVAVADFNQDGVPDIWFHQSSDGFLRLLYGSADGSYREGMKIDIGSGQRSLAAGDFNNDGLCDIAISNLGIGALTILYQNEAGNGLTYQTSWLDSYRDYILSANLSGTGIVDLLGANFAHIAEVLDLGRSEGTQTGSQVHLNPVLDRTVTTTSGYSVSMNATMIASSVSVNLQNLQSQQMANIVNVSAGSNIYLIAGDINFENSVSLVLATPKK